MKREMIEKVVRVAVERNIVTLNGFNIPEEERFEEIVAVIQEGIKEKNKKSIEAFVNGFSEYILETAKCTTEDDSTGEQRPLTSEEIAETIYSEYWRVQGEIDDILSE
ncbi:hypothetical protein [Cellulosilyticum sp. WCF-2]|uniref:hypothetical protein n=1 Tax=Cellulosilyticum sp. WCF-2 TaxID=2497860 RepID=UPI000F8EFE33|nr:hypothetical protein [Cellulosilyticum sp. WCF-2]QEH68686.1 hypothetical protein EKH84_09975 [Cellulosilyticum sp. WCF-2]